MEKTRAKGSSGDLGWINRIDRKARWKVKGLNNVPFFTGPPRSGVNGAWFVANGEPQYSTD